jgi:hypothetical protein
LATRSSIDPTDSDGSNGAAPAGFTVVRAGRRVICLRDDLAQEAPVILVRIKSLDRSSHTGAGNRRSGFPLEINDHLSLFVRWARRGGLVAHFNRDLHFGLRARLLRELAVAGEALRRGIPVAEPLGMLLEPIALGISRGAMITRALGGMTLWEFLRTDNNPALRGHVLGEAQRAIATMHQNGLCHADLNLHNLFVTRSDESVAVVVLDLDKARFYAAPLADGLRRNNLDRLRRSARKLDPAGRVLTPDTLRMLIGEITR